MRKLKRDNYKGNVEIVGHLTGPAPLMIGAMLLVS
jgi:hypothetical protein